MRTGLAFLILSLMAGDPAMAAVEKEHAVCWRGRPSPECHGFILTDFGLQWRLDDDPTAVGADPYHVSLDVGYAHNTSARDAFGGTIYLGAGTDHARVGVRGRYRRWLSRDVSVDVAPGILVIGSEDVGWDYQAPGFMVTAGVGWKDLVGLTVEAEHSRYEDLVPAPGQPVKVSDTAWRAGLKLGRAPGVIGTLAIVGLFVAVVATGAAD